MSVSRAPPSWLPSLASSPADAPAELHLDLGLGPATRRRGHACCPSRRCLESHRWRLLFDPSQDFETVQRVKLAQPQAASSLAGALLPATASAHPWTNCSPSLTIGLVLRCDPGRASCGKQWARRSMCRWSHWRAATAFTSSLAPRSRARDVLDVRRGGAREVRGLLHPRYLITRDWRVVTDQCAASIIAGRDGTGKGSAGGGL